MGQRSVPWTRVNSWPCPPEPGGAPILSGRPGDGDAYATSGIAEAGDALRGLRPVAHRIAQAPDAVDGAGGLGVAEDGLQRGQVRVHVGDDGDAHTRRV